jgi:hypothetical protein
MQGGARNRAGCPVVGAGLPDTMGIRAAPRLLQIAQLSARRGGNGGVMENWAGVGAPRLGRPASRDASKPEARTPAPTLTGWPRRRYAASTSGSLSDGRLRGRGCLTGRQLSRAGSAERLQRCVIWCRQHSRLLLPPAARAGAEGGWEGANDAGLRETLRRRWRRGRGARAQCGGPRPPPCPWMASRRSFAKTPELAINGKWSR